MVAIHDNTTGRTCNQNLNVEESTLAELKQLYVNKGYENHTTYSRCRIPTLDEYLEWFKGKDCLFFIEIKSNNTDIVNSIKKVINKYDMYGQCTVITFNENIMAAMHEKYPEMPMGCLNGVGLMSGNDSDADMPTVMNSIGRYNGTHNPTYESYTASDLRACLLRGISVYPWTILEKSLPKYYKGGFGGLTNDFADLLGDTTYGIEFEEIPQFLPDTQSALNLKVSYYNHTTEIQQPSAIVLLEGNATVIQNTITPADSNGFSFIVSFSYRVMGKEACVRYTQPITVNCQIVEPETEAGIDTEAVIETQPTIETEAPTSDESEGTAPLADCDTDTTVVTESREDTTDPIQDKGCHSAMSGMALLLISLGAVVFVTRNKMKDSAVD